MQELGEHWRVTMLLSFVGRGRCLEEQTVTMVGLARFSLTLAFTSGMLLYIVCKARQALTGEQSAGLYQGSTSLQAPEARLSCCALMLAFAVGPSWFEVWLFAYSDASILEIISSVF